MRFLGQGDERHLNILLTSSAGLRYVVPSSNTIHE